MPLVTATIASIEKRKLPDLQECFGLVVLSGGVALAIGEASATGSTLGVVLCLLSVVAAAFMLLVTAKTLHSKLTALELAFLTAPITFFCLLPPFFVMESSLIVDYISSDIRTSTFILLFGSILALVYNVVHNDLVAITGPVTTTVLGQIKIILLMLLSGIFFGMYQKIKLSIFNYSFTNHLEAKSRSLGCRRRQGFFHENEHWLCHCHSRIQHVLMGPNQTTSCHHHGREG